MSVKHAVGFLFLCVVVPILHGQVPVGYRVTVVNDSGETLHVAIVGSKPGHTWRPDGNGILPAAGRYKEATVDLYRGERAVMVWDKHGQLMWIEAVNVDAPSTIQIGPGGRVIYSDPKQNAKESKNLFKKTSD